MILKDLGLPEEYRREHHLAKFEAHFVKRRGDDCYSITTNGTRTGKVLAVYALLAEDGDDAIDMLDEVENMICAHQWLLQERESHAGA